MIPRSARDHLSSHAAKRLDANEAAMTAEAIRFIDAHPDHLWRTCLQGHLTGSAWIVSPDRSQVVLTHHRKLGKWLQCGGHADGEPDMAAVALKEAFEESGLTRLSLASGELFDFDRHEIPARGQTPAHWHFDFRFLIHADPGEPLRISDESNDLAWVPLDRVTGLNPQESMARMVRKTVVIGANLGF